MTLYARGKLHCLLKSNYIHSKTHLKSYYVEKCLRSRKLAEGEKISSSAIVYFASLHGEAVDMENFLQILQRTMKILAMPGRLSTILMANIKNWADETSKRQVIRKVWTLCGHCSLMIFIIQMQMAPGPPP